jgi:peptidase E
MQSAVSINKLSRKFFIMNNQIVTSAEVSQDQQEAFRNLLDSEVLFVGGGEAIGCLN